MRKLLIRWLVIFSLLFIAIAMYGAASRSGIFALLILAFAFEAVFWLCITRKKKTSSQINQTQQGG